MKTIFILGGGGFLANEIEEHFRNLGWRAVAIGRSAAASRSELRHVWALPHPEFGNLLATEKPQLCVNAAGTASVSNSLAEPLSDFDANTGLNSHILEDLRRRSPATIYIHLSSAAVYGEPAILPIREDAKIAPISPYGWHRRLSEMVAEEYARHFGMRTASLRIFSAYGVSLKRQVVWDLASRAIAHPNQPLLLQGCPEDSRDFIHGGDVARALQMVVEQGELAGECYNVAGGTETPIHEIAALVLHMLGRSSQISFNGQRHPGNPSRWHADINKVRSLGFSPRIGLNNGVRQVVEVVIRASG
jgi:UDP-glucose 4-epimerase